MLVDYLEILEQMVNQELRVPQVSQGRLVPPAAQEPLALQDRTEAQVTPVLRAQQGRRDLQGSRAALARRVCQVSGEIQDLQDPRVR